MTNTVKRHSHESKLTGAQEVDWDNMRYDKRPTFQALKPDAWDVTDEFTEYSNRLSDPLATCAHVALLTAQAACSFFRGVYPLPISLGEYGYEEYELPWFGDYHRLSDGSYTPIPSVDVEIERFAENLRGQECMRGSTFFAFTPWSPVEQWTLQSLAVEVMIAVDSELMSIKAGDLAGALWWQALAFENLVECHGQANVVLGIKRVGTSTQGCVQPFYQACRPERVRRQLPDHLAALGQ